MFCIATDGDNRSADDFYRAAMDLCGDAWVASSVLPDTRNCLRNANSDRMQYQGCTSRAVWFRRMSCVFSERVICRTNMK